MVEFCRSQLRRNHVAHRLLGSFYTSAESGHGNSGSLCQLIVLLDSTGFQGTEFRRRQAACSRTLKFMPIFHTPTEGRCHPLNRNCICFRQLGLLLQIEDAPLKAPYCHILPPLQTCFSFCQWYLVILDLK